MHSFFPIVTIYNKKRRLNNFLFHRLHWTTKIVSVVFYLSRWISLFFLLPWIVTSGSFYMCWKVEKIKIDIKQDLQKTRQSVAVTFHSWPELLMSGYETSRCVQTEPLSQVMATLCLVGFLLSLVVYKLFTITRPSCMITCGNVW